MKQLSDKELINALRNNDTGAFSVLFDRYSEILLRFIAKRTGTLADAEDILQDVFTSLWNRRAKIEIRDSIYPYLFQAAKYEIIDWTVKQKKRISYFEQLQVPSNSDPVSSDNNEERLLAKELSILLEKEVAKMPTTMQSAFNLSRLEGLSIKEIAYQLSLSEQTVKNNISLALNKLRLWSK